MSNINYYHHTEASASSSSAARKRKQKQIEEEERAKQQQVERRKELDARHEEAKLRDKEAAERKEEELKARSQKYAEEKRTNVSRYSKNLANEHNATVKRESIELRQKQETEKKELNERHQAEREEQNARHANEKKEQIDVHAREEEEMRTRHEEELANAKTDEETEELQRAHEREREDLREKHANKTDILHETHQKEKNALDYDHASDRETQHNEHVEEATALNDSQAARAATVANHINDAVDDAHLEQLRTLHQTEEEKGDNGKTAKNENVLYQSNGTEVSPAAHEQSSSTVSSPSQSEDTSVAQGSIMSIVGSGDGQQSPSSDDDASDDNQKKDSDVDDNASTEPIDYESDRGIEDHDEEENKESAQVEEEIVKHDDNDDKGTPSIVKKSRSALINLNSLEVGVDVHLNHQGKIANYSLNKTTPFEVPSVYGNDVIQIPMQNVSRGASRSTVCSTLNIDVNVHAQTTTKKGKTKILLDKTFDLNTKRDNDRNSYDAWSVVSQEAQLYEHDHVLTAANGARLMIKIIAKINSKGKLCIDTIYVCLSTADVNKAYDIDVGERTSKRNLFSHTSTQVDGNVRKLFTGSLHPLMNC